MHYYGAKEELWLPLLINPVNDIWNLVLVHDFGSTRGYLYSHNIITVQHKDGSCIDEIGEILAGLTDDVVEAVSNLEHFIEANYVHTKNFPKYNVKLCCSTAFPTWEQFIKEIEGGKQVLNEYEENIKYAESKAGEQTSDVLERQMGVHAMHPGVAPGDWVKPGGMPQMGYRPGMKGMEENRDV
eukprot:10298571-Ditylum_brightwellii.AAC.1